MREEDGRKKISDGKSTASTSRHLRASGRTG